MGNIFAGQYNRENFGEDINMKYIEEKLGLISDSMDALNEGINVIMTVYNPSTSGTSMLEVKVPHDRVEGTFFSLNFVLHLTCD